MKRVKPLYRYVGGKAKLLKIYARFFQGLHPQHCVDYFGGSGNMSLWFHQLYPDANLFLNERDPAIYKLFKCIQDEYEEFCQELQWLEQEKRQWLEEEIRSKDRFENMKKWYYSIRDIYYNQTQDPSDEWIQADFKAHPEEYEPVNFEKEFGCSSNGLSKRQIDEMFYLKFNDITLEEYEDMSGQNTPLEHAWYFFLRKLSFSGTNERNKKGEYTSAAGIYSPTQSCYHPEVLAAFKAMLDHAELHNNDYRDLDIHLPRTLHYFDPPYVETGKNLFVDRFDWEQTEALCEYMQRVSEHSTVFLSHYDQPRLKKLMKGFDWHTFPAVGGMHNKRKKDPVREILFYKIHPSIAG